jgi:hypothetical protein
MSSLIRVEFESGYSRVCVCGNGDVQAKLSTAQHTSCQCRRQAELRCRQARACGSALGHGSSRIRYAPSVWRAFPANHQKGTSWVASKVPCAKRFEDGDTNTTHSLRTPKVYYADTKQWPPTRLHVAPRSLRDELRLLYANNNPAQPALRQNDCELRPRTADLARRRRRLAE